MRMYFRIAIAIAMIATTFPVMGQEGNSTDIVGIAEITDKPDTVVPPPAYVSMPLNVQRKPNVFQRILGYLTPNEDEAQGNKLRRFSIIGGPRVDSESGFGLGLVGTTMFRLKGCDEASQPSNFALSADVSFKGFWSLRLKGNILFPNDKMRINIDARLAYSPTYYWGTGYDECNTNANKTAMKKLNFKIYADCLWRIAHGLYMGPAAQWDFNRTNELERPELLHGDDRVVRNYGAGVVIIYDTRDFITGPTRGVYLHLSQIFKPKWLGNHYHYNTTQVKASYYHTAWRDAIIAGEVQGIFNWGGHPSWAGMAPIGDMYSMRGYYPGRYNDRHLVAAQVELRQRIWGPVGVVAWGGVGSSFHDTDSFKHLLPNGGVGLRWAFRSHTNIRFDYGFGKNGNNGFMFTVNEAF